MMAKYTSYENAWKAIDDNNNQLVCMNEFIPFCEDLGYTGDPSALFKQLLKGKTAQFVTLADLISKDAIVYCKNENSPKEKLKKMNVDSLNKHDRAVFDIEARKTLEQAEMAMHMSSHDWTGMKEQLIHRYGTISAAWRLGLDAHENGKMSFTEFATACHNHSFEGNIRTCFQEIDTDGSGMITFDKIDPEWFRNHQHFRELIFAKYGSFEAAVKVMDKGHTMMIEFEDFQAMCKDIGYNQSAGALYKQLLYDTMQHLLHPDDLDHEAQLVVTGNHRAGGWNTTRAGWVNPPKGKSPPFQGRIASCFCCSQCECITPPICSSQ